MSPFPDVAHDAPADPSDTARELTIDVGRVKLRVAVRPGDGTRTPLLLMNGIGAPLEAMAPLVDAIDPAIEVIRFDAPGIGGSTLPSVPYRFWMLTSWLARVLDELGHDRVDVLGLSWGGALAQQFAVSERSRCRRVVLVATATGSIMVPASPLVLRKMVTPRRYRDPMFLRDSAGALYGGAAKSDPDRLLALMHAGPKGGQRTGYVYQLLAGAGWTSVPFLPFVSQPTLILSGKDDPIIPVTNGRILSALIRRSRLTFYDGGHVDLCATPETLVPTIEAFLAEPDSSA